jgi:hypothetical protein
MYGGGAVLIREVTRRTARSWGTVLVLGAAYGLIEAGVFDGSLFNPSFEGMDFRSAYVPALGISAINALHFVVGHAVWSITIPIVLVELLAPARRSQPWLGKAGLTVTAVAYLLGGLLVLHNSWVTGNYRTSPPQFAGTVVVAGLLVAVAFALHPPVGPATGGWVPRPALVGVAAFVWSSVVVAAPESWVGVVLSLAAIAVAAIVVVRLARRTGWGGAHRLALAGGPLFTYGWGSFVIAYLKGRTDMVDLAGNAAFIVSAVVLVVVTARRVPRVVPSPR